MGVRFRILVLGASGTGTSTLGRTLANALGSQHFDTDDFLWVPSDPPFRKRRPSAERLDLMEQVFLPRRDWVLSGAVAGWGERIAGRLTHVIFLSAPSAVRLARIRTRERYRHGGRIAPGGDMAATHRAFLEAAMRYDDATVCGPTRLRHEAWLDGLDRPVIRLDANRPPEAVAEAALVALSEAPDAARAPVASGLRHG